MASTDARPLPRKNTAYRVTFPIWDADGDLVTGATGLDSEVSIDGGTFADCTNEATEIATSSGMYYLDLTSAEMNGDTVAVIVKTSSSGAKTTPLVFYPEEAGDLRVDVVQISGDTTAADNLESAADGTGYNLGGGSVVAASVTGAVASVTGNVGGNVTGSIGSVAAGGITASSIAADAIGASELAADAAAEIATQVRAELTTELGRIDVAVSTRLASVGYTAPLDAAGVRSAVGLASANLDTQLSTIDDFLDTEVAAIKAKTDNLPSDPADQSAVEAAITAATAGLATAAALSTVDDFLDTEIAAIKAKTDNLPASPAAVGSAMTLTSGERTSIADAFLDRDMSTGTDSGSATVRTVRQALRKLRNKWSISGSTWSIYKEDDTTVSYTETLTTDSAADPVIGSDPASS
jgi:hypothetical protein